MRSAHSDGLLRIPPVPAFALRSRVAGGQSLIESTLAILLVCLLLTGLLQVSQLFAAREVLHHAAARGARARTVGFNWAMVEKTVMVGAIANAGKLDNADYVPAHNDVLENKIRTEHAGAVWDYVLAKQPDSDQHRWERDRIPDFLGSDNIDEGRAVLDYEHWDDIGSDHSAMTTNMALVRVRVWQNYPLTMPAHRAFYAGDSIPMEGNSFIENHYSAYLDDAGL